MFMKMFAGLVLVAGLALSGLTASHAVKSCCYPGAECCFSGSPCCNGENQVTASSCCYPGAECCFPDSPCCGSFVSTETDPAPKTKAGCGGCCAVKQAEQPAKPVDAPKAKAGCGGCKGCCAVQQADQPAKVDAKASKLVVDDLECASCAKTVIKAISAVVGVENATADIKTKTLTVTPKADKTLSPKDLWEAVEKAGFKPVKFEGPEGAFDKKPAK